MSIGAFITAIVAVWITSTTILAITFTVMSILSLLIFRPFLAKYQKTSKEDETGIDGKYIGKFAKVLIMQLLPGTQGIYGLLVGFITLSKIGLLGGGLMELTTSQGLLVFCACLPIGVVGLVSAYYQGKTSAAAIGIVAKKPEQFGKAMLFPAMVETYAILALLISILSVTNLSF